jgi:membrane-associated phospholipid phosphatase
MPRRSPILLSTLLIAVAVAESVLFIVLYRLFVMTGLGQHLDTVALASNTLGADRLGRPVNTVLDAISLVAVGIAAGVVGFIALIRRRIALAVTSVVLIVGANATAQLLKRVLDRPDLGIDEARAAAGNSFPSGHTTIAASVVVAFVLVLPPRTRGVGAVVGSLYAAIVGVATLSAGWHRPSDAIAAFLIVGVWAALAGVLLRILRRRGERVIEAESHKTAGLILWLAGGLALVAAVLGLWHTDGVVNLPVDQLSERARAVAYAGSAAGIVAASALMMAVILATVHRVVPRRPVPRQPA